MKIPPWGIKLEYRCNLWNITMAKKRIPRSMWCVPENYVLNYISNLVEKELLVSLLDVVFWESRIEIELTNSDNFFPGFPGPNGQNISCAEMLPLRKLIHGTTVSIKNENNHYENKVWNKILNIITRYLNRIPAIRDTIFLYSYHDEMRKYL